jgi:hypothetical protein
MIAFLRRQGFAETSLLLYRLSYVSKETTGLEPAARKLKCSSSGIRHKKLIAHSAN